MTPDEIAKERSKRPDLQYTITLPEGEYAALLMCVLDADVRGSHGLALATKDALVNATISSVRREVSS